MTTIASSASAGPPSAAPPVFAPVAWGRRRNDRLTVCACGAIVGAASLSAWVAIIYTASLLF
jgi:hypothetical protein